MLKINKILSKKIKSPLSLRGLFSFSHSRFPFCHYSFSFCHSRESGNPSPPVIAREQSNRSNLNLSGFSLIELMVAVVILALAIFGIFHAYSVGFMGMADARDRTVATNYLREAMEDVKNMDFEKITTTTKSVTDGNRKYRIDVNLIESSNNYKKVYAVVSWKDRNGNTKIVNSSLTINFTEIFASKAAKIVLFTNSYSILNTPTSSLHASTEIIAVIKDINGNTVNDWGDNPGEGDITFTIISTEKYGELPNGSSEIKVTPIEGRASTTFSSKGTFNAEEAPTANYYVLQEIQASVHLPDKDKTVNDTITIKITDGPVKITLDANPKRIKANTSNYSMITASIKNAAGKTLLKKDIFEDIEITFTAFGEGKFIESNSSTYTVTIPWESGSTDNATITVNLYSTGIPGLVNIVATSTNLESDSTNVVFLGPPVAISISANPNPIYVDNIEGSTISVSLLDVNGYATNPTDSDITISLSLTDSGTGGSIEDPSSWIFPISDSEGIINTTTFSGQNDTGIATITASGGELPDASVTISVISALVPDHIKLEADDQNVPADGTTTIIRAIVYDESGRIVTNYNGTIIFDSNWGNLSNQNFNNGIATIELSSTNSGTATVTVSSSDSLPCEPAGGVVVKFYGVADHIKLEANPTKVKSNGIDYSTITATVCDANGITVTNYTSTIIFASDLGVFSDYNFNNGIATTKLSSTDTGTTTVTASSNGLEEGSVVVEFETTLILVDGTNYGDSENKVITFDVRVIGENIVVDTMKIFWNDSHPNQKLSKINIQQKQQDVEVYSGNIASGITLDIINTILYSGEENIHIELTFAQDMSGKFPIDVIFNTPVSDQYSIILYEPSPS